MNPAKQQFSKLHDDSIAIQAIVCERAAVDGWLNLEACREKNPSTVEHYMLLADAALRAMKRMDASSKQRLH